LITNQINRLLLCNYRNFQNKNLEFSKKNVIIIGMNGSGKTNLLESISLLSPGKGIKNTNLEEYLNYNSTLQTKSWSIQLSIQSHVYDSLEITNQNNKKTISVNNKIIKNIDEINKKFSIVWLTPLFDTIFIGTKSTRTKFFDKIVTELFPKHHKMINELEKLMYERLQILKNYEDNNWLNKIETKLVEISMIISHARVESLKLLNNEINLLEDRVFPKGLIYANGKYEKMINSNESIINTQHQLTADLFNNRQIDKVQNRTTEGVHKTNFECYQIDNNVNARFCSTGEQKSLIISIIIAKIKTIKKHKSVTPIFLIDELSSHLDNLNKDQIITEISKLDCQNFFTTTSNNIADYLQNDCDLVHLN
jgi:DNA replication and repair protein RecF